MSNNFLLLLSLVFLGPLENKSKLNTTDHVHHCAILLCFISVNGIVKGLSELGSHLPTLLSRKHNAFTGINLNIHDKSCCLLQTIPGVQERSALRMILRWWVVKFPSKFTEALYAKNMERNTISKAKQLEWTSHQEMLLFLYPKSIARLKAPDRCVQLLTANISWLLTNKQWSWAVFHVSWWFSLALSMPSPYIDHSAPCI